MPTSARPLRKCSDLKIPFHGGLMGRVVEEALPGGSNPTVEQFVERANPDENGLATVLVGQRVGSTRYFDAAGFPGPDCRHGRAQSGEPLAAPK